MSSEAPTQTGGQHREVPTFADPQQAIHSIHDVLGRKWQPVLLYYLSEEGPLGFSALKSRVDSISSKMLSESLDQLEDLGLVSRDLLSDQPVRVEYSLTARGEAFEPLVTEMVRVGSDAPAEDGTEGRPGVVADAPEGR